MNVARACSTGLALFVIAAGLTFAQPAAAHATATCSGATGQDFDDDGHPDLVVARTLPGTTAGVVDIRMSGGRTQTISAASLGFPTAVGDQFGAAVHVAGFDELDNCPDLVIGAPGTPGGGAVYLVRGNGAGVDTSATRVASPAPGLRFGSTVGVVALSLTRAHLLVGAPGLDVQGHADAGGLLLWQLSQGEPRGAPVTLTYSAFGATPASGDHLGAVLDVADWHVTVGVPDRDVGSAKDAGEVITFSLVDQPGQLAIADSIRVNQNSSRAPGVAESGDRFGASVDAGGAYVLVGAPGEDLGRLTDAGMVVRFADFGIPRLDRWSSWTQDSAGIPGVAEAGDRFGAAVALGWVEVVVDGDPVASPVYAVGAPGEDIGSVRDAGAITLIAPGVRPAYGLSQDSGLPGQPERGDQVGAALAAIAGDYDVGPFVGGTGLLVGAPGEDVGTVVDSGLVMSTQGLLPKATFGWRSVRNLGTIVPAARYGWTLPSAG